MEYHLILTYLPMSPFRLTSLLVFLLYSCVSCHFRWRSWFYALQEGHSPNPRATRLAALLTDLKLYLSLPRWPRAPSSRSGCSSCLSVSSGLQRTNRQQATERPVCRLVYPSLSTDHKPCGVKFPNLFLYCFRHTAFDFSSLSITHPPSACHSHISYAA